MATRFPRRRRRSSGFTLLEALVSLIMFAFIMVALSMALSTAVRAQFASQSVQDDSASMRSAFDTIVADIEGAYASPNNPASQFIAGNATASSMNQNTNAVSGSLLALTTLNHRIASDLSQSGIPAPVSNQNSTTAQPQSDVALVRYDLDSSSGNLMRSVSLVPYGQNLQQATTTPDAVVAQRVVSLTLQFWDSQLQDWRQDWDFEQPNYVPGTNTTTTTSSTSSSSSSSSSTTPVGDQLLPTAVKIQIVMAREDGGQVSFETTIPVIAAQPYNSTNSPATTTGIGGATLTTTSTTGAGATTPGSGASTKP